MGIADIAVRLIGPEVPVTVTAYDGSHAGPADAKAALVVKNADAVRRVLTAPGELGIGRAFVAGDIDLDGDLRAVLVSLRQKPPRPSPRLLADLAKEVGADALRPVAPPPEEARVTGRRHSKERDAAAISHHYDVSNAFYRIVLGPSMTYSCAVWEDPSVGLEAAQAAKHELVCRKLALESGMRLLDVGCGWGSLAIHAATHHGARVVGVTISERQVELARQRVREAGVDDLVEIRLQDYRDIDDGPFDAISSIGMFEHVGRSKLGLYFARLHELLNPGGRLLNHGITRETRRSDQRPVRVPPTPWLRRSFIDRFVFPDGELHEIGEVVSVLHQHGFEPRHLENLREHYALTCQAWVTNIERDWDRAVAESSEGRARVWRLYLSGSAVGFELGAIQVHQVLASKLDGGRSAMPLRPRFEEPPAG
jgi:cyclopropane-fatty-acyl-phospholipid synthase